MNAPSKKAEELEIWSGKKEKLLKRTKEGKKNTQSKPKKSREVGCSFNQRGRS